MTAAFDRIDHDHLLACLGGFPARELIGQWLKRVWSTGVGSPPVRKELLKAA